MRSSNARALSATSALLLRLHQGSFSITRSLCATTLAISSSENVIFRSVLEQANILLISMTTCSRVWQEAIGLTFLKRLFSTNLSLPQKPRVRIRNGAALLSRSLSHLSHSPSFMNTPSVQVIIRMKVNVHNGLTC